MAIAFQPARRRVERWANRLVYGERATPYEVLVRFSRRSAELPDDELLSRLPRLIVDGTGAATAALWVRSDAGFRTAASGRTRYWSGISRSTTCFVDRKRTTRFPVFHDGELLGWIVAREAERRIGDTTRKGAARRPRVGLGLALRNARLTAAPPPDRRTEASRERVLAASDAARRALENDLDSGPQQTLVAVKVKFGPIASGPSSSGRPRQPASWISWRLLQVPRSLAVREFAGGIYPPLLEAEGLAVAIGQQARSSAVPVQVHGDGVGRDPRDIEAAVYFSVLEASRTLPNTPRPTRPRSRSASEAVRHLRGPRRRPWLRRQRRCKGRGLTGIADRLDTVGGPSRSNGAPGQGTRITGRSRSTSSRPFHRCADRGSASLNVGPASSSASDAQRSTSQGNRRGRGRKPTGAEVAGHARRDHQQMALIVPTR